MRDYLRRSIRSSPKLYIELLKLGQLDQGMGTTPLL